MMGFGGIFGIVLIGLIVWAVFQFSNQNGTGNPFSTGRQDSSADKDSALDILKKRYVRGEISQEEYERMKNEIS